MLIKNNESFQKILISISFGLIGFTANFHTIIFPFGDYTVAVLFGLLFPLFIALSWGWKWGLLSALAGGSQSMWWLWGPSNGYAIFLLVPPFTLWIVWHGFFAELRRKQHKPKWWLNMYIVEIPFRILCIMNLLTLCRWAISHNPPAWQWAASSTNIVPMQFSIFVATKQTIVAFILLLIADVLLHISYVRRVFNLGSVIDYRKTGHIISVSLLVGFLFWIIDSLIHAFIFYPDKDFIELFATDIPESNIFTRIIMLLFCLCAGLITSNLLRRQRESDFNLEKSEEDLSQILKGNVIATFVIDKDLAVSHWNKAAENLTGINSKEIVGTKNQWRAFSPVKMTIFADLIATGATEQQIASSFGDTTTKSNVLEGAYQSEEFYPHTGAKGLWLLSSAAPLKDKKGIVNGAIVCIQDTTNRKQAEEASRKNERLLRSLIRTLPDPVWLKDERGVYQFCNSRFEQLVGKNENEIVGKTDYDFVEKIIADFFRKNDKITMELNKSTIHEHKVVFAEDGHKETLETIKTPTHGDKGQITGVLGIGRNITERLELQAQLVQSQKMETVGRLAGGVAHDFNNMLSIIIGSTEMIKEDLDPSHPAISGLNDILSASERSSNLTRQLLAFARKQTIKPVILDLNNTLSGMLKMLKRLIGENIDLLWHPCQQIWPVKIDPSQVDQIFVNLLVNARDSIENMGKITIETDNIEITNEDCRDRAEFIPGNYVVLIVCDNGCGMEGETIDCLFEPFYTTKKMGEGTGLGLATVYGIVKQNKGFIYVYSEPRVGSIFKIYLPRHEGEYTPHTASLQELPSLEGNETILLVEDERAILKTTKLLLQRLGYNVLAAASPAEALELHQKLESGDIDLLLTDVILPGMSGLALATKLEQLRPGIKCLYMSGYTANVIAHHGILDTQIHFISKPFSKTQLSTKLRKVLDEEKK